MTKDNTEQREGLQQQAQKLRKQKTRQMIVSLIGIAILLFGLIKVILIFINYATTESSNDAQIEQYISPVNLRASGYIKKIYFQEHQRVKKGDTLLVLDDREYLIRLMEAEAALKDAMAGANVISATLNTTETSASVYDASIAEIEVRLEKLAKDRQRYQNLVARNAATPIQLEQIETEYIATKKKLDAVQKQKKAALSGVTEVERRRANSAYGFNHYINLVFRKNFSAQVLKANMRVVGNCEYGLIFYRDKLPKFNNKGRMVFNCFDWISDSVTPKVHETQKPVPLLENIISVFTDVDDVVIDCCAGSGTTLLAAKNLSRRAYGFELKRKYVNDFYKKILPCYQPDMFCLSELQEIENKKLKYVEVHA